jgi:hypothetical protein
VVPGRFVRSGVLEHDRGLPMQALRRSSLPERGTWWNLRHGFLSLLSMTCIVSRAREHNEARVVQYGRVATLLGHKWCGTGVWRRDVCTRRRCALWHKAARYWHRRCFMGVGQHDVGMRNATWHEYVCCDALGLSCWPIVCWHIDTLALWHIGAWACWHIGRLAHCMFAHWHIGRLAHCMLAC